MIGQVRSVTDAVSTASAIRFRLPAQSLSHGTSEQAASVEETSASLEQMHASITQNAENSRRDGTDGSPRSGRCRAERQSGQRVCRGDENHRRKISIIEEIAYQTNLLALNAAIEAARGRRPRQSFAVVATEVGSLPERSQNAAQEIRSVASSSVTVAEKAGRMLSELVPAIHKTARVGSRSCHRIPRNSRRAWHR